MHVDKDTGIDYPAHGSKEASKLCFWLPLWPGKQVFGWSYGCRAQIDSKQHAISDSEGNSSKTPQPQIISSMFVINNQWTTCICTDWWLNMNIQWLNLDLVRGKKEGQNYIEPHPHMINYKFPWNLTAPQNPTALATHFSKCIPIKHHHWNLATW